jgi:hypothetical protein
MVFPDVWPVDTPQNAHSVRRKASAPAIGGTRSLVRASRLEAATKVQGAFARFQGDWYHAHILAVPAG